MLLIAWVQFLMNPRSTSDIIPNVRSRGAAPFKAHPITPLLGLPGPKTGFNCFFGASNFRTFPGSYWRLQGTGSAVPNYRPILKVMVEQNMAAKVRRDMERGSHSEL